MGAGRGHSHCDRFVRAHHLAQSRHLLQVKRAPVFLPSTPLHFRSRQSFGWTRVPCSRRIQLRRPIHLPIQDLCHQGNGRFVLHRVWLHASIPGPSSVPTGLLSKRQLLPKV